VRPFRPVAREAAILAAGSYAALGCSFAGTILVARALGPDGRGLYAWLLTLVFLAVQLAALAPVQAVRAIVAERGGVPAGLPSGLVLVGLGGSLLGLPVLAYAALDPALGAEAGPYLLPAFATVPLAAAAQALQGVLVASGRVVVFAAAQTVPRLLQFAAVLWLSARGALDLRHAIWLAPAAIGLELLFTAAAIGPRALAVRPRLAVLAPVARRLGEGWIAALALFLLPRIGLLALGATAGAASAGQYSVALTLQEVAGLAPAALGGVLVSRAGVAAGSGRAAAAVLAGAALVLLAGWWLAPLLVPLVFGASYAPAADLLRPLLAGTLLVTGFQLLQPALWRDGRRGAPAIPAVAAAATAALVAFLAVPRYGEAGAVASNLAGFAVLAVAASALVRTARA
jgi:O-antigen/teichoic acid export membrane protein